MILLVVNLIYRDVTVGPNEIFTHDFTNKTGVFIFQSNSKVIIEGKEKEITKNTISFTGTKVLLEFEKHTCFSYWDFSQDLCKSGEYFFDSPFIITSNGMISANSDVCFFSGREFSSNLVEIEAMSTSLFSIQFFVNSSSNPKYQCKPTVPRQKINCQYPLGEPFFFRIINPETLFFKLRYSSVKSKGNCSTFQIPSNINRTSVLNMIEECTTIQQHNKQVSIRFAIFIAVAVGLMIFFQVTGTINFFFWRKEERKSGVERSEENAPFFSVNIGDEFVSTDSY